MNFLSSLLLLALSITSSTSTFLPATPSLYTLPPTSEVWPEGVATHPQSSHFYTASSSTGALYRGSLNTPSITPFITTPTALGNLTQAWGLKVTKDGRYILVAGGTHGAVWVFSIAKRTVVAIWENDRVASGWTFLNDFAVDSEEIKAPGGDILVTDSLAPVLWKIPAKEFKQTVHAWEKTGVVVKKTLTNFVDMTQWSVTTTGAPYLANGIVYLPGGRYALVGIMTTGYLIRVDLRTGATAPVSKGTTAADDKVFAFSDGLLFRPPYLFSLNGGHDATHPSGPIQDFISVIKLSDAPGPDGKFLRGKVVGRIESELFNVATTMAFVPGTGREEVLVANHQLTGGVPVLPFSVARVPLVW